MTKAEKIEKFRQDLYKIKLKTFINVKDDMSNIDDILDEYRTISKVVRDLVDISGKSLKEVLTTQAIEFFFFRECLSNIKMLLEYVEEVIRYQRGRKFNEIRKADSRDLSDRAINQLIDANDDIFKLSVQLAKIREVYDRYQGVIEAYNQRGYSLNNITKALEVAALETIL
jgi:hypothetical protein